MIMLKTVRLGFFVLAVCFATGARAHGGAAIEEDMCGRRLSHFLVHFSLYQPQIDEKAEYCSDVPATGPTIMVVDLVDYMLRFKQMSLQILDLTTEGEEKVLVSLPPRTYPQGVIRTNVTFEKAGKYAAVLSDEDDEDVRSQMSLMVAQGGSNFLDKYPMFWVIFGTVAFVLLFAVRRLWSGPREI